jgi:hypothetical protein
VLTEADNFLRALPEPWRVPVVCLFISVAVIASYVALQRVKPKRKAAKKKWK